MSRSLPLILCLLLLAALTGCAGGQRAESSGKINQWLVQKEATLPPITYKVQPPDKLRIVAPKIKELDGQEQVIRPDGVISLNLIGDVPVAGKTPEEIGRDLRRVAAQFYDKDMLDISVQVAEFNSQVVYVFGQVNDPGVKPYTGRDTIITVLAAAQINELAWPQRIVIVRPHEDADVRQKVTVDLKEMYQTGEVAQNYMLEPGDLIYVPPSPLAQLAATFEKLLVPFRPVINVASLAYGGI